MNEERWEDPDSDDSVCKGCGRRYSSHGIDQYSGRLKCPVVREEKHTPPQEGHRSPRGDY